MSPFAASNPEEVNRLAEANPEGIYVQVTMDVQSAGVGQDREAGIVFLNSEPDYRNFKSLNIELCPDVVKKLIHDKKLDPVRDFLHHTIRVTGKTKRIQIAILDGPDAGRRYFQTHLQVTRVEDIKIL